MNTIFENEAKSSPPALDRFGSWTPASAGVTPWGYPANASLIEDGS